MGPWTSISQLLGSRKQLGQDINGWMGSRNNGWVAGPQEIKVAAWLGPRKSWLGSGIPEHNGWAPGNPESRKAMAGPNQIKSMAGKRS